MPHSTTYHFFKLQTTCEKIMWPMHFFIPSPTPSLIAILLSIVYLVTMERLKWNVLATCRSAL